MKYKYVEQFFIFKKHLELNNFSIKTFKNQIKMAELKNLNIMEAESNDENINDIIANAGKVTEEIVNAAAEKIATLRKEKVTEELIKCVQKVEYTVKSTHISYRRSNKCNKKIKQYLKDLTDLKDQIVTGKISVSDWDKKSVELKKQLDKDLIEIGKECDNIQNDLEEIFPEARWSYRYDNLVPKK